MTKVHPSKLLTVSKWWTVQHHTAMLNRRVLEMQKINLYQVHIHYMFRLPCYCSKKFSLQNWMLKPFMRVCVWGNNNPHATQ